MNYHNITHSDMMNGQGLRVVLWVSGCTHRCVSCQNPETHAPDSGIPFDKHAWEEIRDQLNKDYISGITFSGGDPLCECNRETIDSLIDEIKLDFPNKNIWLYTGYTWEEIQNNLELKSIVDKVDIVCEGRYIIYLNDPNKHWVGSSNQRVVKVQESIQSGEIVLLED